MKGLKGLEGKVLRAGLGALVAAAVAVKEDLVSSGTMPFASGHLQNSATLVDVGRLRAEGAVAVVSDAVYARRLLMHPEFEFDQSVNSRAGGRWFDAYADGDRAQFLVDEFVKGFRDGMG